MIETQPYFVDEPAARRVSIDATQLYDVRAAPDATQLYDEGAETRANPNETQLYDQVSIVTRVHVEETQLYDQTNVVTRKAYAEETQLYDQHIVTTVREATQLYDQGARDEEETQLYDAHADIRPPPRGGSIVAEQTQLYDQKEDNERERAELARKRRREEEDAEAMETMIYDEVPHFIICIFCFPHSSSGHARCPSTWPTFWSHTKVAREASRENSSSSNAGSGRKE